MTADIFAIVGVGVALAGLILYQARGLNELRRDMAKELVGLREQMHRENAGLRERMARLEGLFEGFAGRKSDKPE